MKSLLAFLLLLVSGLAIAQDMGDMKPPAEVSNLDFMLGRWTGKETMHFGPEKMESKSTVTCSKVLNGRFVQSWHTYDVGGMKMEGMFLGSYDPDKKKYVGWWFDGMASEPMAMSGNMEGNNLVMISEPTAVPGMPGKIVFRATWGKKGDKESTFKLEQKEGDKWTLVIDGTYTKA